MESRRQSDNSLQAAGSQIETNIVTEADQISQTDVADVEEHNPSFPIFTKITGDPEVIYSSRLPPKDVLGYKPKIYMPYELDDLLQETNIKEKFEGREYICIRYLVRIDVNIVFGKEGYPNATIPAHYQLVGQEINDAFEIFYLTCLSAGNAYFDIDTGELFGISNKSGDFEPPFNSMQFALHALFAEGIKMRKQLRIIKLDRNTPDDEYIVDTDQLKTDIASLGLPQKTITRLPPPPGDDPANPKDLLISDPVAQQTSFNQRFRDFWAAHWKKMLVCAVVGSLLVVAGVFTAGVVPMIAAGLGVGVATAAGIGFGGAAAVGAIAGVGVGAIAGAYPSQEESGVKAFLKRHKWKILIGALVTFLIVGGALTGGIIAAVGVAGLGAIAAGGVAATLGVVGTTVSATTATAIGATVATAGVATISTSTGFLLGAIFDNNKPRNPEETKTTTHESSDNSTIVFDKWANDNVPENQDDIDSNNTETQPTFNNRRSRLK